MSLLSKIHDEFTALRARAHELVNPVETIEKKLHEVIDALVADVHGFEARIGALEGKVHDSIAGKPEEAPAVVIVRGEPKPVDELVQPVPQVQPMVQAPVVDAAPSSSEPAGTPLGNLPATDMTRRLLEDAAAGQVQGVDPAVDAAGAAARSEREHSLAYEPEALNSYRIFASADGSAATHTYVARRTGRMRGHMGPFAEGPMAANATTLRVTGGSEGDQHAGSWVPTGQGEGDFSVTQGAEYTLLVTGNGSFSVSIQLEEV